jgi:hypothetical protein
LEKWSVKGMGGKTPYSGVLATTQELVRPPLSEDSSPSAFPEVTIHVMTTIQYHIRA